MAPLGRITIASGAIAQIVFEHGHLWRHRRTTVPIGSVASLQTNAIGLALTKDEFGKLPSEKA